MAAKPRSSRVTLSDVAHHAGVSITTVSLILSGREEWLKQFHPDTVQKVRDSAAKLRYRAHLFASRLPTRQSSVFAMITRDMGREDDATTPWHLWAFEGGMLAGVMKAAAEMKLYALVANALTEADEEALNPIENVIEGGVFGAIIRSPGPVLERYLRRLIKRDFPLVVLFPDHPSEWSTNTITNDDEALGRTAAELLVAEGRRELAVVHYADRKPRESHVIRRNAFEAVGRAAGAAIHTIRIPRELSELSEQEIRRFEQLPADGIFAVDSVLSINALRTMMRAGRQPGRDFGLIGTNCSRWQESDYPRITSVDIPWRQVGILAVQTLSKCAKEGMSSFESILVPPVLFPGATCPIPPGLLVQTGPAIGDRIACAGERPAGLPGSFRADVPGSGPVDLPASQPNC